MPVLLLAIPSLGAAEVLPSQPIVFLDGRLVLGGEASVSISSEDEGFFNYTDYDHNTLRTVRLGLSAAFHTGSRVSILGELRTENWDTLRPYALYVRIRPLKDRAFDVQAGRIPPTFGAYGRRGYGYDNPLVGAPLGYQYLTSLRADAVPANADDLLRMRGRGWLVTYPVGDRTPASGLPLASAFRWDTGVQARVQAGWAEASGALTVGSLSNPRVRDDNDGRQLAGRLALRPTPGLVVGLSGARAAYLGRRAVADLPGADAETFTQDAFGFDVEYSRDYWLVRTEAIVSRWQLPAVTAPQLDALSAWSMLVEGRYKLRPGLYAAGRLDALRFSRVDGTQARQVAWDAPVTRVEAGVGYSLRRNIVLKGVYQHNWRDMTRYASLGFVSAQLLYWF